MIHCDFATRLAIGAYKTTVEAVVAAHEQTGLTTSVVRVHANLSVRVTTLKDGFKVTK